jgi:predicted transcriptional regulator
MDHVKSVSAMAEYFDVELSNIQADYKKDIDKWVITFDHNGKAESPTDTNVR